ncbi:MAG TPA: thiamine-phosphate kinase [Chitinophagaceae bacterium]|nr:thiamine-phosphate kinase [Chitinophagaceae bacterium]
MKETTDREIAFVNRIAGAFPRHPMQVNGIFEADSEVIALEGTQAPYLVVKTDGIHEEITGGLYKDPYLIGWMAITVTMSDLAATGAEPTGILLSLQVPRRYEHGWMQELQRGINEACSAYGTYILGGDTNYSPQISIVTTGVGFVNKPILRKGTQAGDLIYTTAALGAGNAFAYSLFFDASIHAFYKPLARMRESRLIREFASACIDTSDGLFPALSILAEINDTGLRFYEPLQSILSSEATSVYEKATLPAWFFLAGPHGEYELLFSIPRSRQEAFDEACSAAGLLPLLLGEATPDKQVSFITEDLAITCHPSEIANLYDLSGGDIQTYFNMLIRKHDQWCATKTDLLCKQKTLI